MAAYVKARAHAEASDFEAAIKCIESAPDEYWDGCGNCMEVENVFIHAVRSVWDTARLPYAESVATMEAIIRGQFTSIKTELWRTEDSARAQRQHARDEAALILGELHLRNGHTDAARKWLRIAAKSSYDSAYFARAHLKKIDTAARAR